MTYEDSVYEWQQQLAAVGVNPALVELGRTRELAGRSEFGDSYLNRDNIMESVEELADFLNYVFFKVLQREAEGKDGRMDLALIAAHKAQEAHEAAYHLEHAA